MRVALVIVLWHTFQHVRLGLSKRAPVNINVIPCSLCGISMKISLFVWWQFSFWLKKSMGKMFCKLHCANLNVLSVKLRCSVILVYLFLFVCLSLVEIKFVCEFNAHTISSSIVPKYNKKYLLRVTIFLNAASEYLHAEQDQIQLNC